MTVYASLYIAVGHRKHMNISKTFSRKLVIRRHVFLPPKPSDTESTNEHLGRGEKATVG
jgi:hypothetical protein